MIKIHPRYVNQYCLCSVSIHPILFYILEDISNEATFKLVTIIKTILINSDYLHHYICITDIKFICNHIYMTLYFKKVSKFYFWHY